ncbi:MAG TPA: hemerythrin domain-containing protein [Burkholderiales bacterium]
MAASKAKQTKRAANMNAIDLLKEDHARVKKLFKAFEKAKEGDHEAIEDIVTTACTELKVHSKIEEEIFYPAVRAKANHEIEELLNEAKVEHGSVDALVEKLTTVRMDDEMYKANFTVVVEYVKHHVEEEEKEMFPKVQKLRGLDLDDLGMQLRARQEKLMGELIKDAEIPGHEEMEDEPLVIAAQSKKSKASRGPRATR